MSEARVELEVPAEPDNVRRLRQEVAALAERCGASPGLLADIALAVSEACTNAVLHAYTHTAEPGALRVTAEADEGMLTVRVADAGRGMIPRPDSPGLGLGLPLVAQLADRFEVGDGLDGAGTQLCMHFSLRAEEPTVGLGVEEPELA